MKTRGNNTLVIKGVKSDGGRGFAKAVQPVRLSEALYFVWGAI